MLDRSPARFLKLAAPLAALALLTACSSSNNNKNNGNVNSAANAPAATTVVTSSTAAVSLTPARASSPTSVVSTARPGSPTTSAPTGSSPTAATAAAQAGSCSGPAAGGAASSAAVSTPAPGASADEKLLRSAALTLADLPAGYSVQSAEATPPSAPGETGNYDVTYTCIGQGGSGLNIQAIVDGLFSFSDAATASTGFQQLPGQITQQAGEDFQLTPVTNAPKVGDDTLAYKVSGSTQGVTLGGYAVIWRHGRFGAAVIQVGAPAAGSIDDVASLAQKQDAKLQSAR